MILLPFLLPALASAPAGPTTPRTSVNVQISDQGRVIRGAATLEARGATAAARCTLRDDGRAPTDMHAGDGVWCCDLAFPGDGPWEITVRSDAGQQSGTLAAGAVPVGPPLFLSLEGGRLTARSDIAAVSPADAGPGASRSAVTVEGRTPRLSPSAWVPLLALLGALLAPVVVLWRGRERAALPLLDAGFVPHVVPADGLDALLAGPLAGRRVVWLGPERDGVYARTFAATPQELVHDVERLAASPGAPVALVVAAPALLERGRRAPWPDLAARVGGRFPLYGVGAPWAGTGHATPPSIGSPGPSSVVTQAT